MGAVNELVGGNGEADWVGVDEIRIMKRVLPMQFKMLCLVPRWSSLVEGWGRQSMT